MLRSLIRILVVVGALSFSVGVHAQQYQLIETMPGVGEAGQVKTFPEYVTGLYNFALAFVIVSALLMITIGGFYYIVSAGNQAQAGTAKKIITDALIGLIVVFVTWLVLYTINPDLLNTTPDLSALQSTGGGGEFNNQSVHNIVGQNGTGTPGSTQVQPRTITSVVGSDGRQYPSEQACRDAGATSCTSTQTYYQDNQMYLEQTLPDGSTRYVAATNPDACSQAGASCVSGADIKKQEMYNTTSDQKAVEALNAVGIKSSNDTQLTPGMGKHTKEVIDATVAVAKQACGAQGCEGMRATGAAKDGKNVMVLTYDDPQKDAQFVNNKVGREAVLTEDTVNNLPKNPQVGEKAQVFRTFIYPEGNDKAGQIVTHTVTKEYNDTNGILPGGGEWRTVNSQVTIHGEKVKNPPTQKDDIILNNEFELETYFP